MLMTLPMAMPFRPAVAQHGASLCSQWHGLRRLWVMRWLVMTRAAQLRCNVFMMDSDNGITSDIYSYFKAEAMRPYQMLTPYEPSMPGINAGAVYVQNAHQQVRAQSCSAQLALNSCWCPLEIWGCEAYKRRAVCLSMNSLTSDCLHLEICSKS
jgi:hypothetical protein